MARKNISSKEFDKKFDRGEDISIFLDKTSVTKKVNVDFSIELLEKLDMMAKKMGVTRQSLIKVWLYDRLTSELERQKRIG